MKANASVKKYILIGGIALVLCIAIVCGTLFACGGKNGGENSGKEEPVGTFYPEEYESNGQDISSYRIVYSKDAGEPTEYAAECLNKYLAKATGESLAVTDDNSSPAGNEILLGKTNRAEDDGIDYSSLGEEGYKIKSVGNKLVIAGNDSRGVIYGVYAFLESLGYRFYTAKAENIPLASNVFVPKEIDVSWNHVFDYREMHFSSTWWSNSDFAVRLGINGDFFRPEVKNNAKYGGYSGYIGGETYMSHTFTYLLSPDKYYNDHPEYYALVGEGRKSNSQPCFTNLESADEVYKNAVALINSDPTSNIISISQNDNNDFCECENCLGSYEKYGKSGTMLNYINRIAERMKENYPDIIVDTFAYSATRDLPKGGVVPADNIQIRVCMAPCEYHTNSKDCERYKICEDLLKGWGAICKRLSVYYYCINWANLFSALPNYDAMYSIMKMYADYNVKGVYCEGYPKENPEFGELKAYLFAKLLKNPYMSKAEYYYHMDDFITGYYGDAGEYIKEYIDLTHEVIMDNAKKNGELAFWFGVEDNFVFDYDETTHTYDMTFIDKCNELWDNAEEVSDNEVLDRVKKSRIHWTYIELFNTMTNRYRYGTEEERDELAARNKQLYSDIFKYGTTAKNVNNYIPSGVTTFELSPQKWR